MKYREIDVILTWNLKDYSKSKIGVWSPGAYIKSSFLSPDRHRHTPRSAATPCQF